MSRYTGAFIIRNGVLVPADPNSFAQFAATYGESALHVEAKLLSEKSSERMKAYYHGPFINWFIPILRGTGVPASKGAADMYFMSRFGVDRYEQLPTESGEIIMFPILEKQSSWSFKRWNDYINDCCTHCAQEYSATDIPDAQEYLRNKTKRK